MIQKRSSRISGSTRPTSAGSASARTSSARPPPRIWRKRVVRERVQHLGLSRHSGNLGAGGLPIRSTSRPVTGGFRRRLFTAVLARVRWSKTETRKGRRRRYLKNGIANRAKGISSSL